jgi:hypothetical protein
MSNAFTNFLGGAVDSFLGGAGTQPAMKDFQHADRLYVRDTYARAPKHGFLYFVSFNVNPSVRGKDPSWRKNIPTVGLLVKKIDLPKFAPRTETINQYNRKTVVQTGMKYNPIAVDFHDDNSDITTRLWTNYYNYYYGDGNDGTSSAPSSSNAGGNWLTQVTGYLGGFFKGAGGPDATVQIPASFKDTKYRSGKLNFNYGLNNNQNQPFFDSIDIYVLHQHKFTQYTLVNPVITEWTHDSVDQAEGSKILSSKMNVVYESVIYNYGKIKKGSSANAFTANYYDVSPSPLSIAGGGSKSLLGPGGVIAGAGDVLGDLESGNFIGAFLKGKQVVQNAQSLTKAGIFNEGAGLLSGTLNNISANSAQGVSGIGNSVQRGIIGGLGFTNSANLTQTVPSKITGK